MIALLRRTLVQGMLGLVRAYRVALSPYLGSACRFDPSCSAYLAAAVEKHGPLRGVRLGILRLAKCHPFHAGGFDPVP